MFIDIATGSIIDKSPADRVELQEADADAVSCYVRVDCALG